MYIVYIYIIIIVISEGIVLNDIQNYRLKERICGERYTYYSELITCSKDSWKLAYL